MKIVKTAWDDIKSNFRIRLELRRETLSPKTAPLRALERPGSGLAGQAP